MYTAFMKTVRNSAKAIIIEDGKILCVKFQDRDGFWYILPGGGQNHGETLTEALIRECREELNAEVKPGKLRFIRDYISAHHEFAHEDNDAHQVEFMFSCSLLSGENLGPGSEPDPGQLGVEWLPLERLDDFRLYPQALKKYLKIVGLKQGPVYLGDVN
ncbi:MAG: NUDIX domain-containing protein [Candidatus Wallbacteria bacterium]|nr:NUDIX domain-containing protein [Candidatus Wallbacteria bacterium]